MIERIKNWIKTHKKKAIVGGSLFVVLFVFFISYSLAALSPVKSIIITSKNTSFEDNEAGSWQAVKSAKWTGVGKAEVSFDVDTTLTSDDSYQDVVLLLPSYSSSVIKRLKDDVKEFANYVLSDNNNRVALITYNRTASILSDFSNDRDDILNKIDSYSFVSIGSSFYELFLKLDDFLSGYKEESNRELVVLLLGDGSYIYTESSLQTAQYNYLKQNYPYMNLNLIQVSYSYVRKEFYDISDNYVIVDKATTKGSLSDALYDFSVVSDFYSKYQVVDYIDDDYFSLSSDDIVVDRGSVVVEEENGVSKIVWDIDNFRAGDSASLTMKLNLRDQYINDKNNYSVGDKTVVMSEITNSNEEVQTSDTPVLAGAYQVNYDGNNPSNCVVKNLPVATNYPVFNTIAISDQVPSCSGYEFKGWEIVTDDVERINDDYFIMPESNVTIRATWSKVDLAKSMEGEVYTPPTLYQIMEEQSVMDNVASTYVSSSSGVDFNAVSSDTNGKGVYTRAGTENDTYPILYYRGAVDNNHVKFGGFCWKIVRTTSTGGVKLIYDGVPDSDGVCDNTGTNSSIGQSMFNTNNRSVMDAGYMYGTRYTDNNNRKTVGSKNWYTFAGLSYSRMDNPPSTYYYGSSVTYQSGYGQYRLNNPVMYNYSTSYSDLVGKYFCGSGTTSCTSVSYVLEATSSYMLFTPMFSGTTYDTAIATANNLKWVYGNDVTWDGSQYTLVDTIQSSPVNFDTDIDTINSRYHYTCFSTSNTCTSVNYITNYLNSSGSYTLYYLQLADGKNIEDAKNEMFSNDNDSNVKSTIDNWFSTNMLDYQQFLEDTPWCNDRTIASGSLVGKDSPITESDAQNIYFISSSSADDNIRLSCANKNDSFSVDESNGNGDLTYPTALLTLDEVRLAGGMFSRANNSFYLYNGTTWWTLTPSYYYSQSDFRTYTSGPVILSTSASSYFYVRPSVSLMPGTVVIAGDGTSENPYELDFSKN